MPRTHNLQLNNQEIILDKHSFAGMNELEKSLTRLQINESITISNGTFGLHDSVEKRHCSIGLERPLNRGICYRVSDGLNGIPSKSGVYYQEPGLPVHKVERFAHLTSGTTVIIGQERITLPENIIEIISKPQLQIGLENSTREFDSPYGKIISHTDRGLGKRESNQDATTILLDSFNRLWLNVFDGMGGYYGGNLAAKALAEKFAKCLGEGDSFKNVVAQAGKALERIAAQRNILGRIGACYATAVITQDQKRGDVINGAFQGDCQIIVLDKLSNAYVPVDYTRPDLYFYELIDKGLKEEDAFADPSSLCVTNGLLVEDQILQIGQINKFGPIELREGTIVMIGSDGVLSLFTPGQIAELLSESKNIEDAAAHINKVAKDSAFYMGNQDNQTYILLEYSKLKKN